ncbi:MAG: ion channel [Gammaproteobacteria bacterium]
MKVRKARDFLSQSWQSEAYLSIFLFIIILLVFVFPSLDIGVHHVALYADIGTTIGFIAGIGIARGNHKLFILTSVACVLAIVMRWVTWWMPESGILILSQALDLIAILAIVTALLWQIFRSGPITGVRIQGAIAAYLFLAFWWAHAYNIVHLLAPGSFNTSAVNPADVSEWVNYSFGMLTTVGYGQIVPISPIAHTLTSAEAVTGPLYLAVLIARLVSMQMASKQP